MIYVIASIRTSPGRRDDVLKLFSALVPQVHAEAGCIEYSTAVDLENAIDGQPPARPDMVTVVEKWQIPRPSRPGRTGSRRRKKGGSGVPPCPFGSTTHAPVSG